LTNTKHYDYTKKENKIQPLFEILFNFTTYFFQKMKTAKKFAVFIDFKSTYNCQYYHNHGRANVYYSLYINL